MSSSTFTTVFLLFLDTTHNKGNNELYNKMYYGNEGGDFKRGEFYHTGKAIVHKKGGYTIKGSMGTTHKPTISIDLYG